MAALPTKSNSSNSNRKLENPIYIDEIPLYRSFRSVLCFLLAKFCKIIYINGLGLPCAIERRMATKIKEKLNTALSLNSIGISH